MTEGNEIWHEIYRRHLRLYRYLNDMWIFIFLMRPKLKETVDDLRGSTHRGKRRYQVPKRDATVISRRTDADIAAVFQAQHERGVFEANIVSIVSRIEAHIQDCMATVIKKYPEKVAIIDGKGAIPVEMFLKKKSWDDVLDQYIAARCQNLMFGSPKDYLGKAMKVLSIKIKDDILNDYIEMKASRDIIVHGTGVANEIYVEKAGTAARAKVGEELALDKAYFKHVIVRAKQLAGAIMDGVESTYRT